MIGADIATLTGCQRILVASQGVSGQAQPLTRHLILGYQTNIVDNPGQKDILAVQSENPPGDHFRQDSDGGRMDPEFFPR